MPIVLNPQKRLKQPLSQAIADISARRGLLALYGAAPFGRSLLNAWSGYNAALSSGCGWNQTPLGVGLTLGRTDNATTADVVGYASGTKMMVSAWVRPSSTTTSLDTIAYFGQNLGNNDQLAIYCNVVAAGDVYVSTNNADFYTAGSQFAAGDLLHVAVVYPGGPVSNIQIYINGVSKSLTSAGAFTGSNLNLTTNKPIVVGQDSTNTRGFRGEIVSVAAWIFDFDDSNRERHRINPWQLYAPLQRRVFGFIAAAPDNLLGQACL